MAYTPYTSSDKTFIAIQKRLDTLRPAIKLSKHIEFETDAGKEKLEIGATTNEGVSFVPRDVVALREAIQFAKNANGLPAFHYDNRKNWILRLGAVATHGGGYREIGSPSLHCAIAQDVCNIHLDDLGFVDVGMDGQTYYTPDALPHIADELVYRAYIRKPLRLALVGMLGEKKASPITTLLDRSYLALPNLQKLNMSKLTNKVDLRAGVGMKIAESETVKLRFEYTCGNRNCSDNRGMFIVDVKLDKLADKLRR